MVARKQTRWAIASARACCRSSSRDAAFAAGIVADANLAGLEGYTTGGPSLVINNQIGFTTNPEDARSSTYATDVAKLVQAPVFHVNGDDPEAAVHVAGVSHEYRQRFKRDVVIDLWGYRRWGHNEGDEPSYTQPLMYAKIKSHPSAAHLYGEQLIRKDVLTRQELDALWAEKKAEVQREGEAVRWPRSLGARPSRPRRGPSAMWGRCGAPQGARTVPEVHSPKCYAHQKGRAAGGPGTSTGHALPGLGTRAGGYPVRSRAVSSAGPSPSGTPSLRAHGREYLPLNALAPSSRASRLDRLLSRLRSSGSFGTRGRARAS